MANILITGGAGFIGRWLSKYLIDKGHRVWILDNLSNSTENGIKEFRVRLAGVVIGDIKDKESLSKIFKNNFEVCLHFAAAINVQESIDNPEKCFNDNVIGTFNVLEQCRVHNTKILFANSALTYKTAEQGQKITENHPFNPSSPYAASKIAGENFVLSYHKTYNLPVVILRPFSVYGPWQRSDSEGGVMSIFIDRKLKGKPIEVFGDGKQGRDFLYIEDFAEFIGKAAFDDRAIGQIFNVGSDRETKIKDLAEVIAGGCASIKFVKHPHPNAEIMNMRADSGRAKKILGWEAKTTLEQGINKTAEWLKSQQN